MRSWLLVAAISTGTLHGAAQSGAPPQPPPGGTPSRDVVRQTLGSATVRGRVVAADSGAPLRRALVSFDRDALARALQSSRIEGAMGRSAGRSVLTDDNGAYEIKDLPSGRYALRASKTGYVTLSHGQRHPRQPPREVEIGVRPFETIDFRLPRAGVIVVRAMDTAGLPVGGGTVQVQEFRYAGRQRRLVPVLPAPGPRTTDVEGEIRIAGLSPGAYYVAFRPPALWPPAPTELLRGNLAPTYFPGTAIVNEAQPVMVAAGQEVVITIPIYAMRTARVSGQVRRSDGSSPRSGSLRIFQEMAESTTSQDVVVRSDGTFDVAGIPPGRYVIQARPAHEGAGPIEHSRVPLTVNGEDLTGLIIRTLPAGSLKGKFVFETGVPPPDLKPGDLFAVARPAEMTGAGVDGATSSGAEWTFTLSNLIDRSVVRLGSPSHGWMLKAVMHGDREVTDTPFDFTGGQHVTDVVMLLARSRTELSGIAVGDPSTVMTDASVVVFSEDSTKWTPQSRFVAVARPDHEGRFTIAGLPPGRYLAAALDRDDEEIYEPTFLRRLAQVATPVTLVERSPASVTLSIFTY